KYVVTIIVGNFFYDVFDLAQETATIFWLNTV
ncbi:heptaprenylglyceryl phosphate synthase, partial [Listeria monocytogenes]